jgi:uncharacterized phiE125 gp8 family phage protein
VSLSRHRYSPSRLAPSREAAPIGVYTLVTPPALEPVTFADLRDHARIDGTAEDDYLSALIIAARELVELHTGRALITQTWRLTLDDWPGGADQWWDGLREGPIALVSMAEWVELRRTPIIAITSVTVADEAGTATTWDAANYYLGRQPNGYGRLTRKSGVAWPTIGTRAAGAIAITFTAGYGPNATDVPSALRHGIKMLALHWYEHREPASACASSTMMPMGLGAILASHRVMR